MMDRQRDVDLRESFHVPVGLRTATVPIEGCRGQRCWLPHRSECAAPDTNACASRLGDMSEAPGLLPKTPDAAHGGADGAARKGMPNSRVGGHRVAHQCDRSARPLTVQTQRAPAFASRDVPASRRRRPKVSPRSTCVSLDSCAFPVINHRCAEATAGCSPSFCRGRSRGIPAGEWHPASRCEPACACPRGRPCRPRFRPGCGG